MPVQPDDHNGGHDDDYDDEDDDGDDEPWLKSLSCSESGPRDSVHEAGAHWEGVFWRGLQGDRQQNATGN